MSKEVIIEGVKYVPENDKAETLDGLEYKIVRTYSAGVFAGYLKSLDGKQGVVLKARRLWFWDGAASLSQLAVDGTSKPVNCKFPCEVEEVLLTEIIEVLSVTNKAKNSIESVKIWKQ